MAHEAVRTDLPAVGLPFSWGVRWRDLVFVAGQGPLGPDGKVVELREGAIDLEFLPPLEPTYVEVSPNHMVACYLYPLSDRKESAPPQSADL